MSKIIEKHKKKTRKKVQEVAPRDYTVMGPSPDFVYFNPSEHKPVITGFVSSAEKWLMVVLLAVAAAAFLGFKLLQNAEMTFSMNDPDQANVVKSQDAVSSQSEFKSNFLDNRREARAMFEENKAATKKATHASNVHRYLKTGQKRPEKKYASHSAKKSKTFAQRRTFKKKTLAKR